MMPEKYRSGKMIGLLEGAQIPESDLSGADSGNPYP